jgi:hypothetical protein
MRTRPWLDIPMRGLLLVLPAIALLLGPAQVAGAGKDKLTLDPSLCAPGLHEFTLTIDNPYFPLPARQQWVLAGEEDGEPLGLQITVLDATETLFKGRKQVTTRVVEEHEWADVNGNARIDPGEEPLEISRNYFAQTEEGTVCYFGEAVDIYEDGVVVSHEGSWRADERGNAPGIYMPAKPKVGMRFQQEIAPGAAEDIATIIARGVTTKVPAGTFKHTIKVRDRNPLDGSTGIKFYARDVGLIVDGPLRLVRY